MTQKIFKEWNTVRWFVNRDNVKWDKVRRNDVKWENVERTPEINKPQRKGWYMKRQENQEKIVT